MKYTYKRMLTRGFMKQGPTPRVQTIKSRGFLSITTSREFSKTVFIVVKNGQTWRVYSVDLSCSKNDAAVPCFNKGTPSQLFLVNHI